MAYVTVFVDDAVRGRLPGVCVIDGVATTDRLTISQEIGDRTGMGVAWLLVLAGPLGWLGLFVMSAMQRGGGMLTVTLPFDEAAYQRVRAAKRARLQAELILGASVAAAFVALVLRTLDGRLLALGLGVIAAGAVVKVVIEMIRLGRLTVRMSLDASRRWVTLAGVHPHFVEAVEHDDHDSFIDSPV